MEILRKSIVRRTAQSTTPASPHWIEVSSHAAEIEGDESYLLVRHVIRSGRGRSVLSLHIKSIDFERVLQEMFKADRQATIRAIGTTLSNYPPPSKRAGFRLTHYPANGSGSV